MKLRIPIKYKIKNIHDLVFKIGVLFLIIIPKGGFKIAGIPLTWGYLYLGFIFFSISRSVIKKEHFVLDNKHLLSYLATIPFVVYVTMHLLINGYSSAFGMLISFYVSFVFLPFLFYIYLGYYFKRINPSYVEKLISNAVVAVSVYGIVLFLIKAFLKADVEIPYVTINAADVGDVANKYNVRGNVSKLISTYNNGNIFGICILMLLPMFYETNKSKLKIALVIIALIFTLSRTVWIGLLLFLLIKYRQKLIMLTKSFIILGVFFFLFNIVFLTKGFMYGSLSNFILDFKFGGRITQIRQAFSEITIFGTTNFEGFAEIVYLSLLKQFGLVGVFLFFVSFFTPIFIFFTTKNNNYNYILGAIIYLFICLSDGAILLIPTLCFFYFICTMALINKKRIE